MEVNVKGSGSIKAFKLSGVEPTLTVLEFKKKCAEECGLAVDQQRLFLKGKVLKDEETLEACSVKQGVTFFLVKGASSSGGGPSSAAASEPKKEEEPEVRAPCKGGCGFFGTSKTEGYCSKCFGEKNKKEESDKEADKAKKEEEDKKAEADKKATDGEICPPVNERKVQDDKTKCWMCNKKCGLTGFECKCGYVFCAKHRHAEEHDCDFDHKAKGREIIAKANPNIVNKAESHGL